MFKKSLPRMLSKTLQEHRKVEAASSSTAADLKVDMKPYQLVCVRHGESAWNKDNRFCGWVDVSLSDDGVQEAHNAGKAIKCQGLTFDTVFTSTLKRAQITADIILSYCEQPQPKLVSHWRLNERHYGALTGLNKAEMAEIHGKDQVQIWRRSFDVQPPPMDADHPYYKSIVENEAFKEIKDEIPVTESLKDLIERTMPYWKSTIVPCILNGENILIVAHGTSLRGLVKEIEDLTDEEVNKLNLPTAIPFVYQLDRETLRPLKARQYLADEEIVKKAVEKVASIANKKA